MTEAMLSGKSIIVTGGSNGIGRAASRHFAQNGAKVLVADWDEVSGLDTVAEIKSAGEQALFIKTDVTNEADVEAMVAYAVENFGALDGAFNNAGVEMSNKLITELDAETWRRVINVDLTGVFFCMKHELKAMKGRAGAIVNMASGNGEIAQAFSSDYVSAKHGVVGLTRAASTEFPFTGVRVNALLPAVVLTPMIEDRLASDPNLSAILTASRERHSIGRFAQPIEIARAAKWLLSDESSFVNGLMLNIDGGYTAR